MPREKGNAKFTEGLHVAVTPEMKARLTKAGEERGVNCSIVLRWAVVSWLAEFDPEGEADDASVSRAG